MLLAALVAAFVVPAAAHARPTSDQCSKTCIQHSKAQARHQLHRRHARLARQHRLCGTSTCNRRLGQYMTTRRYGPGGWGCVYPIIDQESGWNARVYNRAGSGAYGIPQALPGSRMASAGTDWATNPATQIKWFFGYVDGRYGGPCGALAHKRATGWY